ncbi:MAG: anti-sigma F factor antagonist [Clostridioides sp.]|jgi:stage II sporulation protein AA (anti-sigma F factor antagonist)|nr:anti-sigma F factor antagonist [Clostridioides sp.]
MFTHTIDNKILLIRFTCSELDHHISNEVRDELDSIINKNQIKVIVFDFEKINFMDSSGIGVIIGRYKKIASDGGRVSVINVNERVRKIFDLSGLNKIINICKTYEESIGIL